MVDFRNITPCSGNCAELILGMGSSTVFPASETQKIINAVADYADFSGGYTPQNTAAIQSLHLFSI